MLKFTLRTRTFMSKRYLGAYFACASYGGYVNSESICKGVTPESFSVPLDLEAYSNDPTMIPSHVKSVV